MAMRSVGSSVGRIGEFMKRVWVREIAKKPNQTFLLLAGTMWFAIHKQSEEVHKIRERVYEQEVECEMMLERITERSSASLARINDLENDMMAMEGQ